MVSEWIYGTVVAATLVQLAALYVLHAKHDLPGRSGTADRRVDEATVECSECGAENERGYRFCRVCVSELPGRAVRAPVNATDRTGRLT